MESFRYSTGVENQLKNVRHFWVYIVGSILFVFFMISEKGTEDLIVFILMGVGLLLLFIIPALIIHLNYYSMNKGDIFIYEPSRSFVKLISKEVESSFYFKEIELIERFMSHPLAEGRLTWFSWDYYNHSIIHLNDGRKFVITSLLVPNLELPIDSDRIKIHKTWYKLAPKI